MWKSGVRSILLGSTRRRSSFPRDKVRVLSKTLLQFSFSSVPVISLDRTGSFLPRLFSVDSNAREVNGKKIESVVKLLQDSLEVGLGSRLDDELDGLVVNDPFVVRVLESSDVSGVNFVRFYKWAFKKSDFVKSSSLVNLLVKKVCGSSQLSRHEAYALWDFLKEISVVDEGLITVEILNQLISTFGKLGKNNLTIEVFNMFEDLSCVPDGDSYYLAIQAMGKKKWAEKGSVICNKMVDSKIFPDAEKVGKIIKVLCRSDKSKDAFLVYSKAKEDGKSLPTEFIVFLINHLSRKPETIHMAIELLDSYSGESVAPFAKVIKFLCITGKSSEAFLVYSKAKEEGKSLPIKVVVFLINQLARKPDTIHSAFELLDSYSGESPAAFASVISRLYKMNDTKNIKILLDRVLKFDSSVSNKVLDLAITTLAKDGPIESARDLLKEMKNRGLKPNTRAYNTMIGGFSQLGRMDEARTMFDEAKKTHSKLGRFSYHILIQGYSQMGEFENGLRCFYEMKEDGIELDADDYRKLIVSLCQKSLDWRTAQKLLKEMQENEVLVNRRTRRIVAMVKQWEDSEIISNSDKFVFN